MRSSFRFVAILVILSTFMASCDRSQDQGELRLGVILSLTGPAAPYGQDNLKGVKLAQQIINSAGGVRGHKLALDIQDSAGDPAQAVALAQRFAADKQISAIIGPTRTGSTVAVARLLPRLQIVMMSVGSTGDWPTAGGTFNDWTFRSTRVDSYLIKPLLGTARDRFGIKNVAIIYSANDDWSVSVLQVYKQAAQDVGITVTSERSQMTGDTDRSAQLTEIIQSNPDALIINTLASDAPLIAAQARRLGFKGRFIGTAGFTNPQTWDLAGPGVLEGTLLADNFFAGSSRPAVKRFVDQYKQAYSAEPPAYAAYAYDGVMLVAEAARRIDDFHDRKALRDALGSIADFEGALGRLTYRGKGDAEKAPLVLAIKGKDYELVSEKAP